MSAHEQQQDLFGLFAPTAGVHRAPPAAAGVTAGLGAAGTFVPLPEAEPARPEIVFERSLKARNYRLTLRNGVLVQRKRPAELSTATATVTLATKMRLMAAAAGDFDSPGLTVTGDAGALQSLLGVLDTPNPGFSIITP